MHLLYSIELKKLLYIGVILLSLFIVFTQKSHAAITGAKDTVTTSRPSPSTPLSSALGSTDTQASVFNNGSRFLASDSAKLIRANQILVVDQATIISSQSAGLTTVFYGEQAGVAGQAGIDVQFVPITAMHTVEFTVGTQIPVSGIFTLTFPSLASGDADNDASPSATTFQFNNILSGGAGPVEVWNVTDNTEITSNVTMSETEPGAGTGGILSFTLDGSTDVDLGDQVRIFIGCTASTAAACTTQAPRIINPTKTAVLGTADSWKIRINTLNASSSPLESTTIGIATVESVTVRATVDPTLSFSITGIDSGTDLATGNSGCAGGTYGQNANSGINSTPNEVNLGVLQNTPSAGTVLTNIAGQYLTVSTNGSTGYTLTATSASSLLNPSTGYIFLTTTTPSYFLAGSDFFGFHPCGNDVDTSWVEGTPGGDADCNFVAGAHGGTATECFWAWPNATNSLGTGTTLTIASDATGPIGTGTGETGDGITSVAYSAGTDVLVPPGEYRAIVTYIATPSF